MLDIETRFNYSGIDRVIHVVSIFPQEMKKIARAAFSRRINLPVLQQLRKTPKRRYWTAGDFESDASRRAFFAKTGGKAYVRTGKYAAGWKADITEDEQSITFGYANPVPYADKVGGQGQVRGHTITGWPFSGDIMTANQPRSVMVFGEAIGSYLDEQLAP